MARPLRRLAAASLTRPRRCFFQGLCAAGTSARASLTVRDAIAWAQFCTAASATLPAWHTYAHGAYLTLLDGLGLGLGVADGEAAHLRSACEAFLLAQVPEASRGALDAASFRDVPAGLSDSADPDSTAYGLPPFLIEKVRTGPSPFSGPSRSLRAMTSKRMSSN